MTRTLIAAYMGFMDAYHPPGKIMHPDLALAIALAAAAHAAARKAAA